MILLNLIMSAGLVMAYTAARTFITESGCPIVTIPWRRGRTTRGGEDTKTFCWKWLLQDTKWFEEVYGKNAMQFLLFERYLLLLLTLYSILVCGVIMPINIMFGELKDGNNFISTTLGNLKTNSPYLWVHVFVGWSFAPMAMAVMRRFATQVLTQFHYISQGRALVLEDVPNELRNRGTIRYHFFLLNERLINSSQKINVVLRKQ